MNPSKSKVSAKLVKEAKSLLKQTEKLSPDEDMRVWHNWLSHPKGKEVCAGCKTAPIPERAAAYMKVERNP